MSILIQNEWNILDEKNYLKIKNKLFFSFTVILNFYFAILKNKNETKVRKYVDFSNNSNSHLDPSTMATRIVVFLPKTSNILSVLHPLSALATLVTILEFNIWLNFTICRVSIRVFFFYSNGPSWKTRNVICTVFFNQANRNFCNPFRRFN